MCGLVQEQWHPLMSVLGYVHVVCLNSRPAFLTGGKADNENGSGVCTHSILYIYCLVQSFSHRAIVNCSVSGSRRFCDLYALRMYL